MLWWVCIGMVFLCWSVVVVEMVLELVELVLLLLESDDCNVLEWIVGGEFFFILVLFECDGDIDIVVFFGKGGRGYK